LSDSQLTKDQMNVWRLTDEKINDLQVASIDRLLSRCSHAHYVNVYMRINGKDELVEADWLKHLHRGAYPSETRIALLEECAALVYDAVDMMEDGPDESDIAYAMARIVEAGQKAKAIRRLSR
jgi:hypothetical protein